MCLASFKIDIFPRQRRDFTVAWPRIYGVLPHIPILPRNCQHHSRVFIPLQRIRFLTVFMQFWYVFKRLVSDEPATVSEAQSLANQRNIVINCIYTAASFFSFVAAFVKVIPSQQLLSVLHHVAVSDVSYQCILPDYPADRSELRLYAAHGISRHVLFFRICPKLSKLAPGMRNTRAGKFGQGF
ncbi:hypothetical protein D3C75_448840 [compost metagenome]